MHAFGFPVWLPIAISRSLGPTPKIQPKPTQTASGGWQLRITAPKALREAGFLDGAHEFRRTTGPCPEAKADAWAARLFAEFLDARQRFEDSEAGNSTSAVIEDYQALVRRSSFAPAAAEAASGAF